jgi:hypothetical protein
VTERVRSGLDAGRDGHRVEVSPIGIGRATKAKVVRVTTRESRGAIPVVQVTGGESVSEAHGRLSEGGSP